MDATSFICNLKAIAPENGYINLEKVFDEYKTISLNLSTKDKESFALNVLCVLCRNLDKVPQWRDQVDNKSLLILSIECVRCTRIMGKEDRVKTLACIYHIHRHIIRQNAPIPPELVLKFSYMPFECDNSSLLTEYHKTYWSIVAERLTYIEKLKSKRINITKLLPKLIEDILKVIKIYDVIQFCANFLVFLIKKLHLIFNDSNRELNECFQTIFHGLANMNLDSLKKLKDKDAISIYEKFNECFVVVIENGSKIDFKGLRLDDIVRNCANMLGHRSDIFHCLQTFYLNAFCCVLNDNSTENSMYVDTILKNMTMACETTEKLGYKEAMYATYPYLNQFLRIYIENKISDTDLIRSDLSESTQINCLKLMLLLMRKLRKSTQLLKCENCAIKSGLHDALRLSFLVKNFINVSIIKEVDLKNTVPLYFSIVEQQYVILYELRSLGCSNFNKCFRKLQTDVHNTAITLNKAKCFEISIKIFDVYLINEVKNFQTGSELRNLTRGLYNKSICELDCKLYDQALNDAFLTLVLAYSELGNEKYMSLVMDIKAKTLKHTSESVAEDASVTEENQDNFQMLTVLDVTRMLVESNLYGDLKPFVKNVKFSVLLKHEFSMYVKLWPSLVPIAGVWRSLRDLVEGKHAQWLPVIEDRAEVLKILYEVVLETPTAVRTIHSDYYKEIILELAENLEEKSITSSEEKVVLATLLFLKSEYDMTDASQRYAWKTAEHTIDPDQGEAIRTFAQEHHASKSAVRAVEIWTDAVKDIKASPLLHHALQIAEVSVHQFLYMQDTVHGLQLANICCELAMCAADREAYVRNVGIIISYAERENKFVNNLIGTASKYAAQLMTNTQTLDACLTYICDLAIFYNKLELFGASARLVGFVQARILEAFEAQPNINLDLSVGRLMEAQYELSGEKYCEQTILSSVNNIQKHYIAVASSGTAYTKRRMKSMLLKHRSSASGLRATHAAFSLRLFRRARAAAAATLPRAAAATQAFVYGYITNVGNVEDTQVKIDNRLKHILGLQPTNEIQPCCLTTQMIKHETYTPKTSNLEIMLDSMTFKKTQTSPSLPSIPAFKMPEFFNHEQSSCTCYACQSLSCDVIACFTCGLEASMYFRAKQFDIARNYYEGVLKMFEIAEGRFKSKMALYRSRGFNENILDVVACGYRKDYREILIQFIIDASLFELAQKCYDKSDDFVIRIHEIISEMRTVNPYIENDVHNLMVTSAHVRRVVKTSQCGLETDFESLKISSVQDNELLKTPESKCLPVNPTPKIVKAEEVPNIKLKVIKLNLDENIEENSNENVKLRPKRDKKAQFKVPVPVTMKPALETITPRPSRSKLAITLTQPSQDVENTPKANEFFTPKSTPSNDLFFTPMTSVKTYSKKGNVVKNLEAEFSTPTSVKKISNGAKNKLDATLTKNIDDTERSVKDDVKRIEIREDKSTKKVENKTEIKNKVETGSLKSLREKRSLKRVTSPGKLVEDKSVTRSRRRQPMDIK